MNDVLLETDWLASQPVYYNQLTGRASANINDVIDLRNMEFDHDGVVAFLDHGYSVFGRTLVKNVRFLPPSSRLVLAGDGGVAVERVPDELDKWLQRRCSEAEVIDLIRARVRDLERSSEGEIVIPTSGGRDSRLLNLMIEDRSRVRSFTYGTSEPQLDSLEVHRARTLAQTLGTRWEAVPLGLFHMYFDRWDEWFGPAVHAHGMYQVEFYDRILSRVGGGNLLLSGLHGDWFAGRGGFRIKPVESPDDVRRLIEDLGVHADSSMSPMRSSGELYAQYFEENRDIFPSRSRRLIEFVRFRTMLLHYLTRVPREYGFQSAAPFVDIEIATAMMSLPEERRGACEWEDEYFAACGVGLEDVEGQTRNTLNLQAMRLVPLQPLDESLLREVVRPDYVRWINRNAGPRGLWQEEYGRLLGRRGIAHAKPCLRRWGLLPRRLDAYRAYLVLKPLERLIWRRDVARTEET